ncbi:PREDICTED: uncharacterized protein LOC109114031 [Nelumbo nucifera]|uniref:Uncharacterized protein n=2 Tax=Nelumbo nucifera TaxID=4432 RepID=A0A822Z4P5_NELNU|nr:PREDICTED: uncharacterized protein LOC109114031 [Nelumbo nucifera]DAD37966.1 TPA_asm: hypothetical protein HUJ06_008607 [Nelumbo nucifera]
MGCNKSKHDVAAGNTVRRRKKLSVAVERSKEGLEPIPEGDVDGVAKSPSLQVQQQQQQPEPKNTTTEIEFQSEKVVGGGDVKDVVVNTESNDGGTKEAKGTTGEELVDGGNEAHHDRLISRDSPDHYFSSRKNEDAIDAIVGDEGGVVYFSPPHEPDMPGIGAKHKKGFVDEGEKRTETEEKRKSKKLEEKVLVKEEKVVTTIETRVVTTIENKNKLGEIVAEHLSGSSSSPPKVSSKT